MELRINRTNTGHIVRLAGLAIFLMICAIAISCAQMQSGMEDLYAKIRDVTSKPGHATVSAERLNLRKGPTTKSQIVAVLQKGDKLTIKSTKGEWASVVTPKGQSGWVHSSYISGYHADSVQSKTVATADGKDQKPLVDPAKKEMPSPQKQNLQQDLPLPSKQPSSFAAKNEQPVGSAIKTTKTYTCPQSGKYEINYPHDWIVMEELKDDPKRVRFISPSQRAEVWVVNTHAEQGMSAEDFYLDLVSPLHQRFKDAVEIAKATREEANGVTWLYGRAIVNAVPNAIYKYSITQHQDDLLSVVLVAHQGIDDHDFNSLNAIRASFTLQSAEIRLDKSAKKVPPALETSPDSSAKLLDENIIFKRISEPREKAFTVLVPARWKVEGGIVRINPLTQGGPAQSIAAKLDFIIKKDSIGTVMEHWLPDVAWFDPRWSPAGQMGMMPLGSNYQGMTVMHLMSAQDFLRKLIFPKYHGQVHDVKVIETRQLPKLANAYYEGANKILGSLAGSFHYDAASMWISYAEGDVRYKELLVTVIEDMGSTGAGMWTNKLTFFMRAPVAEYARWEPIFAVINHSVRMNPTWVAREIKGQMIRNKILDKTQKEIQQIGREIAEHRYRTNAEIQNDMFLTLMGQEEYVNPYTKEIEIGTDKWKYRWVNEGGDVIYTDKEEYNPNVDINLKRSDYKRTPIRKRFGQ